MNFILDGSPANSGICLDPLTLDEHYAQERSLLIARLMQPITELCVENAVLGAKIAELSS